MKVLVVGATGGSGRATVEELLAGGHDVTAFSRHADELPIRSAHVRRLVGDAMDPDSIEGAVAGQDAVVVALGVHDNPLAVRLLRRTATPVNVCSEGTKNVVAAMQRHGIRRLVVLSAYGVGETRRQLPLPWRLAYRLLLAEQIADKEKQERFVRDSGLDWVIAQPVRLTDREAHGAPYASTAGRVRRGSIPRADVARFLADAITGDAWLGRSVTLSG